jgi:hypothetical protein
MFYYLTTLIIPISGYLELCNAIEMLI